MKLLVTGSDGFTGTHFCKLARNEGYDIIELQSNLLDIDNLKSEINHYSPDFVVHLAAISFANSYDLLSYYEVNVIGTINLLDSLSHLKKIPSKILLASSANIYGNCDVSPIKESCEPKPTNHYAASKVAMESLAKNYFKQMPMLISRPFNYTGFGQRDIFVIPKIISHFIDKKEIITLGNINVKREYNNVQDICKNYLGLLKYGQNGEIYNICSGIAYSIKEIIKYLEDMTGHRLKIKKDSSLIRDKEIKELCGDPQKLNNLLNANSINFSKKSIQETLLSMIRN